MITLMIIITNKALQLFLKLAENKKLFNKILFFMERYQLSILPCAWEWDLVLLITDKPSIPKQNKPYHRDKWRDILEANVQVDPMPGQ
jgi:hypothetical protein